MRLMSWLGSNDEGSRFPRTFFDVLYPEGAQTLTRLNANFVLYNALRILLEKSAPPSSMSLSF